MKKLFFLLSVMAAIIVFSGCSKDKEKRFEGYIPEDAKSRLVWELGDDGYYSLRGYIEVCINNELATAQFNALNLDNGITLVLYRDSYPKAIGKRVFVSGYYTIEGPVIVVPIIATASLMPLK